MTKRKRDKSRSKTPEIQWELILAEKDNADYLALNAPPAPKRAYPGERKPRDGAQTETSTSSSSKAPAPAGTAVVGSTGSEPKVDSEQALRLERDAWRTMIGMLGCLRGDPKVEAMLAERHPELRKVAEMCGAGSKQAASASIDKAREFAREWFARGLRGSNRQGHVQRAAVCAELSATLKARVAEIMAAAAGAVNQAWLERLLEQGPASEEGPLICALLAKELEGSRYENMWMSRQAAGRYILGDDQEGSGLPTIDQDGARIHPRVCVVVKANNGKLLIDGFYHEGEEDFLNPARVPIGPFLTVYFEGMPLKEAIAIWKNGPPGGGKNGSAQAAGAQAAAVQEPPLPPGWEKRESRSKKGVYYYANPSKGLSQMERPKA